MAARDPEPPRLEDLSPATQAVARVFAEILRRRTGRSYIVVAGPAPERKEEN
jgi:hypothetical protein